MSARLSREVGRKRGHSNYWDGRGRPFAVDSITESTATSESCYDEDWDCPDDPFDYRYFADHAGPATMQFALARWACAHLPLAPR